MPVIIDDSTKVVVQGITGHQGAFHSGAMLEFGTKIVAGAVPGRGGVKVNGIMVFDSVSQAVKQTGADASVVFVPAKHAKSAVVEALEAGGAPVWVTFPRTVRQALDVLWTLVGLFHDRAAGLRLETLE